MRKQISLIIECTVKLKPNYRKYIVTLSQNSVVQSDILMIVNALLEDTLYEKFGYEIEDVERKIEEINYDTSERNELRRKMEAEIGNFIE
jgi:hypothetical protein